MLSLPLILLLASQMYVLKSGHMACETLGGVLLTEETDRREKEQEGCSVEMWGRVDMRRLISSKEVKTTDGELLREIAALMETSVLDKPVCFNSSYLFHSPPDHSFYSLAVPSCYA